MGNGEGVLAAVGRKSDDAADPACRVSKPTPTRLARYRVPAAGGGAYPAPRPQTRTAPIRASRWTSHG